MSTLHTPPSHAAPSPGPSRVLLSGTPLEDVACEEYTL